MGPKKKLGLIIAAAFSLVVVAPAAAQAETADSSSVTTAADTSNLSSKIASDPEMRYVSLNEAENQFGFDPAAERPDIPAVESPDIGADDGPVVTPLYEWWGCEWDGRSDYPHKSGNSASVHGYWVYLSGNCPSTADVTVNLQALGCSPLGCTWINQATDTATAVTPGSGTGHWATPHKACANSNTVAWRAEVWVGLTDFWHPYGATHGTGRDLRCSPA